MKRTAGLLSFITLVVMGAISFKVGMGYQERKDLNNYHYELHALQLTYNDIPVYFVDELPGIGGTREHPDTCLAYYDTVKKAVWYSYLNNKNK